MISSSHRCLTSLYCLPACIRTIHWICLPVGQPARWLTGRSLQERDQEGLWTWPQGAISGISPSVTVSVSVIISLWALASNNPLAKIHLGLVNHQFIFGCTDELMDSILNISTSLISGVRGTSLRRRAHSACCHCWWGTALLSFEKICRAILLVKHTTSIFNTV